MNAMTNPADFEAPMRLAQATPDAASPGATAPSDATPSMDGAVPPAGAQGADGAVSGPEAASPDMSAPYAAAPSGTPDGTGPDAFGADPGTATAPMGTADNALPPDMTGAGGNHFLGLDFDRALGLLDLGGPVVAILIVLSIVALAIIIRKLFDILPLAGGRRGRVAGAVRDWRQGERREALAKVRDLKGPTATVVATAMALSMKRVAPSVLREEVERVANEELYRLRRHLRGLEAIAQVAPLLGLFGTILGMIEAFQTLQGAGSNVDPAMLAGGIWVALLTTAVGLAVAIPCNLALHWFEGRIDQERQAIENLATSVLTTAEARLHLGERAGEEEALSAHLTEPAHAH